MGFTGSECVGRKMAAKRPTGKRIEQPVDSHSSLVGADPRTGSRAPSSSRAARRRGRPGMVRRYGGVVLDESPAPAGRSRQRAACARRPEAALDHHAGAAADHVRALS